MVKSKTGIGHPIFIQFYAPMKEDKVHQDINYEIFKQMPLDKDLLKNG